MTGTDKRQFIPLKRVVAAALLDSYEDKTKGEELYYHFAARGLKKLQGEVLKQGKRYVMLEVNQNTHTATLPTDFAEELFVGVVGTNGMKMPLPSNGNIVNKYNLETDSTSEKCKVCGSPKGVCEDLEISETSNLIAIEGNTYEQKIVKKLYPNGDYYQEVTTPFLDVATNEVVYNTQKDFIDHLSLRPCGCLDDTQSNINVLQNIRPDVYSCYYTTCDSCCRTDLGSYRIFEENGLIQFDYNFKFDKVYLEYTGSMPKIKGQLQVPAVAFETLVEWIKYKSVQNRKNISRIERDQYFMSYERERRNMEKILGRISLSAIIDAATRAPKFNISYQSDWGGYFDWNEMYRKAVVASSNGVGVGGSSTGTTGGSGSGGGTGTVGGTTVITNNNYYPSTVPLPMMVNGKSFNSDGAFELPDSFLSYSVLVYWNGLRYLTRDEYIKVPGSKILTIVLGDKPFSANDNYIISVSE